MTLPPLPKPWERTGSESLEDAPPLAQQPSLAPLPKPWETAAPAPQQVAPAPVQQPPVQQPPQPLLNQQPGPTFTGAEGAMQRPASLDNSDHTPRLEMETQSRAEMLAQDPEFAQLFDIRRNRNLAAMTGGGAEMAERDRELVSLLTARHELTEPEIADELSAMLRRAHATPQGQLAAGMEQDRMIVSGELQGREAEMRISDPNARADEVRERGIELVKSEMGAVWRGASDVLEPIIGLPQMLQFAVQDATLDRNLNLTQKFNKVAENLGDIEYKRVFDAWMPWEWGKTKIAERPITGEDIVRRQAQLFGLEEKIPDVAHKVMGIGADFLYDPMMFAPFISGAGKLTKLRGNVKQGEAIMQFGRKMERAMSPAGAAEGVFRVLPPKATEAIGRKMEGMLERILNMEINNPRWAGGGQITLARYISPDGGMPHNQHKDFLSGVHTLDEIKEAGSVEAAAEMFPRPVTGTKTPAAMTDTMKRAEFTTDKTLKGIQGGFQRLFSTFGNERGKTWVKGVEDNLGVYGRLLETPEYRRFTTEAQDMMLNLATDTAHNVGIANRPGALAAVTGTQENFANRLLFQGQGPRPYANSLNDEVRAIATKAPSSSSLLDEQNKTRIREYARKNKLDEGDLITTYDNTVDTLIAMDVELGYQNSFYAPIKDSYYEDMMQRGATHEQSMEIWDAMRGAAMRGEKARNVGISADFRVVRPYGMKADEVDEFGELISAPKMKDDLADDLVDEAGNLLDEAVETAGDLAEGADKRKLEPVAMTTGTLLNKYQNGLSLNMDDWFRGIAEGHFRNTYAAHMSNHDPKRLIRQLEKAEVIRTPILTPNAYKKGMKDAGYVRESQLIENYVENVAPTRRGERGLVIRTTNLRNHLIDNGIEGKQAQAAIARLQQEVAPANMGGMFDGVEVVRSYLNQASERLDTGRGLGKKRSIGKAVAKMETGNLKPIPRPEGVPDSFPEAVLPARVDKVTRQIVAEEQQLLQGYYTELAELERRADSSLGTGQGTGQVADSATGAATAADTGRAAELQTEIQNIKRARESRNDAYRRIDEGQTEADLLKAQEAYEQDRSYLAQIYDPVTSLGESAEYLKRHYPVRQYVIDTYTMARRNGYVKQASTDLKKNPVPEGWVRIPANKEEYGPFAGTILHGHLYRELTNGLLSDAEGRMSALGRLNSAVSGGLLASPMSIANNFIGGLYTSHLAGQNPVALMDEWDKLIRRAHEAKGIENLPEFEAIGHLLGAQIKALAFAKSVNRRKLDTSGFGRDDFKNKLERVFEDMTNAPFGLKWSGLDYFQGVEDTLKLANYNLALKRFGGDTEKAVEFTRNVMFDYAQLPESARVLRDQGLMTFPGFPLFMAARTVKTAIEHPARLGPADKLSEAVWNMQFDDDETKYAVAAGLAPHQLDNRFIPLQVRDEGFGGAFVTGMSLSSWMPTNILDRQNILDPVTENVATFGIGRQIADISSALYRGDGVAPISSKFGQKVFDPGADLGKKALQTGAFLGQAYSAGYMKKLINYNPNRVDPADGIYQQTPWGGAAYKGAQALGSGPLADAMRQTMYGLEVEQQAPEVARWINENMFPLDKEVSDSLRLAGDQARGRREKDHSDEIAGIILPGVSVVSLEPGTNSAFRKTAGIEAENAYVTDEWDKQINPELRKMAEGRGDQGFLSQLLQGRSEVGMKTITLSDGTEIKLGSDQINKLAQGLYWAKYYEQQQQGE